MLGSSPRRLTVYKDPLNGGKEKPPSGVAMSSRGRYAKYDSRSIL
jgi:hypothetical protein